MLTTVEILWACSSCHLIRVSFEVPGKSAQEAFIDPRRPLRRRTKKRLRRHWPVGDSLKALEFVRNYQSLVDKRWCDNCVGQRINKQTTTGLRRPHVANHLHAGA